MKKSLYLIIFTLMIIIPSMDSTASLFSEQERFELPKKVNAYDLFQNKMFEWDLEKSAAQKNLMGTVISFLSSKCPCSNSHLMHLMDLQNKFPQFLFIGVHSNKKGKKEVVRSFFRKKAFSLPLLFDSTLKLANSFRAIKTPHTFVIGKKGNLLFHGGITNSINFKFATKFYLSDALTKLKNKKPLEQIYARAIGCSIAR